MELAFPIKEGISLFPPLQQLIEGIIAATKPQQQDSRPPTISLLLQR